MTSLRYGIVGTGMMGREHMRNLALIHGVEVVAYYDADADSLAQARAIMPGATSMGSIEDLVTRADLDALVIATPNYLHAEHLQTVTALRAIPILVEKPLVTAFEHQPFIDQLQQNYAAPIWVAMEYRYMPPLQRFLEEMEAATGGVKHLSIREHRFPFLPKVNNWNRFNEKSGGTLVEKCCHFFDLMRLITDAEPVRVMGSGWQAVNHKQERYGGRESDIWDAAFAVVDFDSGTKAMLDLCMFAEGTDYQEEIVAVGPEGRIDCLIPGPARLWPEQLGKQPDAKVVIWPKDPRGKIEIPIPVDETLAVAGDHYGSTYYQHLAFRDMIQNGGKPEVTLDDGWRAVAMGLAAQTSSTTGEAVMMTTRAA